MKRELVRVRPPESSRPLWQRFGVYRDSDGVPYRFEGFGILYSPGFGYSTVKTSPEEYENYLNRFRAEDPGHRAYAFAHFREVMFECPGVVGWIADAEQNVECWQLRTVDRDDERTPLPDLVGKLLPFVARPRGVEKVAAGGVRS